MVLLSNKVSFDYCELSLSLLLLLLMMILLLLLSPVDYRLSRFGEHNVVFQQFAQSR